MVVQFHHVHIENYIRKKLRHVKMLFFIDNLSFVNLWILKEDGNHRKNNQIKSFNFFLDSEDEEGGEFEEAISLDMLCIFFFFLC